MTETTEQNSLIRTLIRTLKVIIFSWQYMQCNNVMLSFKASNKCTHLRNMIVFCMLFQCFDYCICLLEYVIEAHFFPMLLFLFQIFSVFSAEYWKQLNHKIDYTFFIRCSEISLILKVS